MKFKAATGRSLTDDNLRFLGEKAFKYPSSRLQRHVPQLVSVL
ncbi:unnamed protein product [Timema podura]|uniref:Signal transducer and activator of transcription linker domain-containing protein n=1 Tax=Timema podura TaxID=61482 RepID=A0ABN7PML4_TIMPD|nr:unnamed protein product [Timema podura]